MSKAWLGAIWKPKGVSSFKVLGEVKRKFETRKVGHMGTLDPLASGILPVAVGRYTKLIPYVNLLPKVYEVEITFGVSSMTLDSEGVDDSDIENVKGMEFNFEIEEVEKICSRMVGKVLQVPPIFSALKVDGKRAYDLARRGEDFEMKAREVECFDITDLELVTDGLWRLSFRVSCGKGYYVRSLVRDICKELRVDGFMSDLTRVKVGAFEKDRLDVSDWSNVLKGYKFIELDEEMVNEFKNGRKVEWGEFLEGDMIGFFDGEPVCILRCVEEDGKFYLKVKRNI